MPGTAVVTKVCTISLSTEKRNFVIGDKVGHGSVYYWPLIYTGNALDSGEAYFVDPKSYTNSELLKLALAGIKPAFMSATGGSISDIVGYRVHKFATTGNFLVTQGGYIQYLIIAGGGSGSGGTAGGGGAGGVMSNMSGSSLYIEPGTYSIVVGDGGLATVNDNTPGNNGNDSTAFGLTSKGGGRGGLTIGSTSVLPGGNGGSGGGGANYSGLTAGPGQNIQGQGYGGGTASVDGGGGGGGAGGSGLNRNGGPGIVNAITGSDVTYAAGGGGAGNGDSGAGGSSIGGSGAVDIGQAGVANTGSGGGGGWYYSGGRGGKGGSGLVVVRYSVS